MKKLLYLFPALLVIVLLSKGCNYENPVGSNLQNPITTDGPIDSGMYTIHMGQIFQANLVTSNNVQIGVLKIWYDTTKFHFKFVANNSYYLKNIYLEAVKEKINIPLSGNCPNIENFNYQVHNLVHTVTYTFTVPYIYLKPPRTFFISSEVEYENRTTFEPNCTAAWAKGVPFWNCTSFSRYFGLRYTFGLD